MTNRFDERNRLLTYLTQQYLALPGANAETMSKIMGRARYFHTFNEAGTELLVLGGYQYADDPLFANQLPMFVIELNTPLPVNGLTLMAGVEGNCLITKQKKDRHELECIQPRHLSATDLFDAPVTVYGR